MPLYLVALTASLARDGFLRRHKFVLVPNTLNMAVGGHIAIYIMVASVST